MQGKIVKGIAGFYYIHVVESGVYECKAKGIFRKEKIKPLVGDNVKIEPSPHFSLLDRFLVMMESKHIPVILCFNKEDIADDFQIKALEKIYSGCGYPCIFTSALEQRNIEQVKALLTGKTTAIAGPSGVGKSSMINVLQPEANMETGDISQKIERGKHTTRHSELFLIDADSYIMDTPGFSSLYMSDFEKEDLQYFFPEFEEFEGTCRFDGCSHTHEPDCAVKNAVSDGKIASVRYDSYKKIYEELKDKRRY